jgi:hypothetical protein
MREDHPQQALADQAAEAWVQTVEDIRRQFIIKSNQEKKDYIRDI